MKQIMLDKNEIFANVLGRKCVNKDCNLPSNDCTYCRYVNDLKINRKQTLFPLIFCNNS